ncbi:MAG: transporter, partial [Lewinellaceae bacterium]|nr:transporter [Lewinellaceae bacterium]
MKTIGRLAAVLLLTLTVLSNIQAQLTEAELAKIAQNPLANLISLPFQNNTNFGVGPYNRTQNITNFQPVLPFADGKIIARVVVPFVSQPNILSETGSSNGFSDITFSAFYAHGGDNKVSWGVGPVVNIPTAGEGLGAKEWGIGPSFVAVVKPGNWVIGALVNNVWSIGNDKIN